MNLLSAIRQLLPYLRFLPLIVAAVKFVVYAVETDGVTGADKHAAAHAAVQTALKAADIVVADEVVDFLISAVVTVLNATGALGSSASK